MTQLLSRLTEQDRRKLAKARPFLVRHIEPILIICITAAVMLIHLFVVNKIAMIALFFLPVLIAGGLQGVRFAVLTSIFCVCATALFAVLNPGAYTTSLEGLDLVLFLSAWGGFLVLSAAVVGRLSDEKASRIRDLRTAYLGILEMLFRYVESPYKDLRSHLVRCAALADQLARHCGIPDEEATHIYLAALLHDIHGMKVNMDLIERAADLSEKEMLTMASYAEEEGGDTLAKLVTVARRAVTIVKQHHRYLDRTQEEAAICEPVPFAVQILRVVDLFDTMTEVQNQDPEKAYETIREIAGCWLDPRLTTELKRIASLAASSKAKPTTRFFSPVKRSKQPEPERAAAPHRA